MKYKCLVLDHDDTVVDSTASIHYPAHVEVMRQLRPGQEIISLESWFEKNFDPGIMSYLCDELKMDKQELDEEFRIWQEINEDKNPPFFDGIPELLKDFSAGGGLIAVVSHSTEQHIGRHYSAGLPEIEPDFIFGWDHDPRKRKPATWPLDEILRKTDLVPDDLLVVDDLKPGVEMAKKAGVKVAAAGWAHSIPSIRAAMKELCDFWFLSVDDLKNHIFK